MCTHCFSVDVEGFCESMAESFPVPSEMIRSNKEKQEIALNIAVILEFLEDAGIKGTFFILGIIAREQPSVVKSIAEAGHEIASHSYEHLRLYNLKKEVARENIFSSKKMLEDISGKAVYGFRAPDYSILEQTRYLLDYLTEAGYQYDSSIFPISGHDVYGIKSAKKDIHRLDNGLVEYPPATYNLFKKTIPVLGGGYFRLFPLCFSRYFLRSIQKTGDCAMFYTHPYEIGPDYPVFNNLPYLRKLRHYININKSKERFAKLFKEFAFGRAIDILKSKQFILS